MASDNKTTANRANAQRSTGPKTDKGKAAAKMNATTHGLCSTAVVVAGEQPEGWETLHEGIRQSLVPQGALECELADRVAFCLWRLRRVAAFETNVTSAGLEEASEGEVAITSSYFLPEELDPTTVALKRARDQLEKEREKVALWEGSYVLIRDMNELAENSRLESDDVYGALEDLGGALSGDGFDIDSVKFLGAIGIPVDELMDPWEWEGWTVAIFRRAVSHMARERKVDPEKLRAEAVASREEIQRQVKRETTRLADDVRKLELAVENQRDRRVRRSLLADQRTVDKVTRYESHVSRQLLQALHTLERLQLSRAGQPVSAPAVLDVTIEGGGSLSTPQVDTPDLQ